MAELCESEATMSREEPGIEEQFVVREEQLDDRQNSVGQEDDEDELPIANFLLKKSSKSAVGVDDIVPIVDPTVLISINNMDDSSKVDEVVPNAIKSEKASQPQEQALPKKKIDYRFKQIATKKSKKGDPKQRKEGDADPMNPATSEALKDVAPKENKLVLKKRRAPIEVASLEVVEKPMVGVTQSAFQSGTASSLVVIPKEVLKVKPTCRKKKAKIDEDEEEDEENKSNVHGRGVVKPRHTIQPLMNLVVALENQVHKLQAIKNMGFGGFLHLDLPKNSPEFATMLVDKLEINEMCIVCGRNQVLSIEAIDVHLVYGVPLGGKKIVEAKPGEKEYDELVRQFKGYHGGRVPTLTDLAIHLCLETTPLDDDWRRSFLVLVVNSCIKSVTSTQLYLRFFSTTTDTKKIPEYDWSSYAIESLIEWTIKWRKKPKTFFAGPLPFLMHTSFMPREFPLVKEWRQDVVKKRIVEELGPGFGLGKVLDRIPRPDVVDIPIPQDLIGVQDVEGGVLHEEQQLQSGEEEDQAQRQSGEEEERAQQQSQQQAQQQQHPGDKKHQQQDQQQQPKQQNVPSNRQEYNEMLR